MFKKTAAVAMGVFVLGMAPAFADSNEARIFPYNSSENYCPSGLQPISIDGVICCGTPNQSVSYQSMKAHPVTRKVRARRAAPARMPTSRIVCPVGEKGCYTE